MELEPGTEVDRRYTVERLLGHGGMGAVYLAHDAKFGERVALKVAAASGAAYQAFRDRFVREARIGNRLGRASGFVRAFDWGEFGESGLYLGMDLVEDAQPLDLLGGTLEERLQRFAVAAELVGRAHAEGIVHRDLKPENFLQAADGTISLTDFGLAKLLGDDEAKLTTDSRTNVDLTSSRMGMGTPRFMAPEQFEDAKHVDVRADVYSLGVMLFVALTGRTPYDGDSLYAFVSQHSRVRMGERDAPTPRDHVPWLPSDLDAVCTEAIALQREERTATVDALVEGLEAALARAVQNETVGPMVVAPPPPVAPELPPPGTPTLTAAPKPASEPKPKRKTRKLKRPRWRPPTELPPGVVEGEAEREYVNQRDGSILLWIPPGTFHMGSKAPDAGAEEQPVHRVNLEQGLFVGKTPVTWEQYGRFCEAVGWDPPSQVVDVERGLSGAGPDCPVFNVAWQEAFAYCQWAGLRLPTEAEWEYAARGKDKRAYPWGDEAPSAEHCNWLDHPEHGGQGPCPVGSFPQGASPFDCLDMAGNVWEWVGDWFGRYSRWIKDDPRGPQRGGGFKVLRGGSWSVPAEHCRTTTRRMFDPSLRASNVGFRVARSPAGDV